MHLSYLILAHTNLGQVANLIASLNAPNVSFYLHFDRKTDIKSLADFKAFHQDNVFVTRNRKDVRWGGYNMVAATITLLKTAIRVSRPGYLILLSGQDLPIKTNEYIHEFYSKNIGFQYLNYFSLPQNSWALNGGLDRLCYYWFIDQIGHEASISLYMSQKTTGNKRVFFEDFACYGGSQWWSITTACAKYVLNFLRVNKMYDDYMKYCYIPDELYFQSIILNSYFRDSVVKDNLKYIDWHTGPDQPRILTINDYSYLRDSKCLYARKFDPNVDNEIIGEINTFIGLSAPI